MTDCAVITGGTSGLGAAFARALAAKGYDLILVGRRLEKLKRVASDLSAETGRSVQTEIMELSIPEERKRLCRLIDSRTDIDVLINNAGFGSPGEFALFESHLDMAQVHVNAPLELTMAVLPQMKARGSGMIVNVSSVAAFFPMPRGTVYSASKAFLLSFSQSLAMELAQFDIKVQALCPGMTHTDFHIRLGIAGSDIKRRKMLVWKSADYVVKQSLRCLEVDRVVCIPGCFYWIVVHLFSHLPRRLYFWLLRIARI